MKSEVLIVSCHRPKEEGNPYEIVFSNGDKLLFSEEEVFENALYREGESCENYERMCTMVMVKRMMASAASYVLFSMKTETQVRNRLADQFTNTETMEGWAKFTDTALEETIRRLNELGYLDDTAYCKKYIASAIRGKPVSRAGLLNELIYHKGVSKEIAEAAVSAAYEDPSVLTDDENAYRLLQKKTCGRIPEDQKERAKLYRFLAGKGFSYHSVDAALQRIKEEGRETDA